MTTFVITPQKVNLVGVIEFEGEEVDETLNGEVTAIDVITQEEESLMWWFNTSDLEHFD